MIECGFHREHDDNDEHFGLTGLITTCLKFILDEAEDMATQVLRGYEEKQPSCGR